MLRVHLTAEDLLRTRFASQPAPLIEVALALATLQRPDPVFGHWRRRAAAQLPARARPLLDLIPASGTGPDSWTQSAPAWPRDWSWYSRHPQAS